MDIEESEIFGVACAEGSGVIVRNLGVEGRTSKRERASRQLRRELQTQFATMLKALIQ